MGRSILLFIYLVLSIYCFGACMLDYFGIYEPWKLVDEKSFAAFHTFQGNRIIGIFVLPLMAATLFGLACCFYPPQHVQKKWLWLSIFSLAIVWALSFSIQIPIQFILNERKDMQLLEELLYTNWYRFAADLLQVVFVLILLWQSFIKERKQVLTRSL